MRSCRYFQHWAIEVLCSQLLSTSKFANVKLFTSDQLDAEPQKSSLEPAGAPSYHRVKDIRGILELIFSIVIFDNLLTLADDSCCSRKQIPQRLTACIYESCPRMIFDRRSSYRAHE